MTIIDLNADLGEGVGDDNAMLEIVSSASIACGGHAGNAETIRQLLKLCRERGVRAGAHPGYPDSKHFGRLRLVMPLDQMLGQIRTQLFLIHWIAKEEGVFSYDAADKLAERRIAAVHGLVRTWPQWPNKS